jgi:hypothetical protein
VPQRTSWRLRELVGPAAAVGRAIESRIAPGNVAELLPQSPFDPGQLLAGDEAFGVGRRWAAAQRDGPV